MFDLLAVLRRNLSGGMMDKSLLKHYFYLFFYDFLFYFMTFSLFGNKFTRYTGITRLMNDLNEGLHARCYHAWRRQSCADPRDGKLF